MTIVICSISDCGRNVLARGWCHMHYQRWKRSGTTDAPPRFKRDTARFWEKVNKDGPLAALKPELGQCWIWTGSTDGDYGVIRWAGVGMKAHRLAWEWDHGPIPDGLQLDHFACELKTCVNPDHTRPVTPWENQLRSESMSSRNLAKTHCPAGHPYDGENLMIWKGGRRCRICRHRIKAKAYATKRGLRSL